MGMLLALTREQPQVTMLKPRPRNLVITKSAA
jgi:hypothetical protein